MLELSLEFCLLELICEESNVRHDQQFDRGVARMSVTKTHVESLDISDHSLNDIHKSDLIYVPSGRLYKHNYRNDRQDRLTVISPSHTKNSCCLLYINQYDLPRNASLIV